MINELIRQFRGRRDNPLAVYGFPPRRSWIYRAMFVLYVVVPVVICAGVYGAYLLELIPPQWDYITAVLQLTLVMSAILIPVAVPLFAYDFRREERLHELYLTRLEQREVVFGSLYWAVYVALIPMAICLLLHLALVAKAPSIPTGVAGWWGGRQLVQEFPHNWCVMALYLAGAVVLLSQAIQAWLRGRGRRTLIVPHCMVFAGLTVAALYYLPNTFLWEKLNSQSQPMSLFLVVMLGLVVVTVVAVHSAGARAGILYYRSVNPDLMIRHDWLVRERAGGRVPRRHVVAATKRLWRAAFRRFIPDFLYTLMGSCISMNVMVVFLVLNGEGFYIDEDTSYLVLLSSLLGVAVVGLRHSFGLGRRVRLPLVSGRLFPSSLRTFLPIAAAQVISLIAVMYFADISTWRAMTSYQLPRLLAFVGLQLLFSYLCWLLILPVRGRRLMSSGLALFVAGVCVVAYITYRLDVYSNVPESIWWWEPSAPIRNSMDLLIVCLFALGTAIVAALPAGLFSLLMQRIHQSEVADHPLLALSTDAPEALMGELTLAAPASTSPSPAAPAPEQLEARAPLA